jgi:hypothetical protein
MNKYIILILITISALTLNGFAQDTQLPGSGNKSNFINVPAELEVKCKDFFDLVYKSEIKKAFDGLLVNSPFINKVEQINNLIEQTKQSIVLYGKIINFESVSSETASQSLIRLRYLAVHNNYPMRWIFTFYKSPKYGWIVTNVKLDDLSEYFFSDQ